jgi:hypothetical protein
VQNCDRQRNGESDRDDDRAAENRPAARARGGISGDDARQAGQDVILVMALPRASLFVQSISLAPISIRAAGVTLGDFAIRTGAFRLSAVGLRLIRGEHHQPSWFALG